MKTLNRFLHFELSCRQLLIGTVLYFIIMLALYLFSMYWVLHQILTQPEQTIKVIGPVAVGYHIHKKFKSVLKPK